MRWREVKQKAQMPAPVPAAERMIWPLLGAVLFFFGTCLCSPDTVRTMTILFVLLALSAAFLFWGRLRDRIKPPVLVLALIVLMDVVSCAYAVSGKFALHQILKIISAFCIALILLVFTGKDRPERDAATVLEGFAAIAGLVSIDYMSTRWISTPVMAVLSWFTSDYMDLPAVEEGIRMTPILIYPNTFATCMGVGVLLSLGLAVSSEKPGERAVHLVCLSVSALAFVLVFSMGASVMIVPAFLALLALTAKEHRIGLFLLMAETLVVTLLCAFPISITSMTAWTGPRPIPLLCTVAGAAALCALDLLAGRRLAGKLAGHGKAVLGVCAALLAALIVFLFAACTLTTGISLGAGESLRRSAYPAPGAYTLAAEGDGDPAVVIESQNREDAMMHTSSELYRGPLSQAAFTVPEGSMVVWFTFHAETETRLESVEYGGENGAGAVPLGYRLLPGFIANRLQGLRANQNAIQRFVFFEDGLKLFRQSPVIGLGLGGYGSAINSVQSFYYYTYYTHNHYIQSMAETGIIGLLLFLGLLGVSAVCVWRGRKRPLAPALGAALVFLACHSSLDGVFSYFATLPMVYCVFAAISLCCGDTIPRPAWAEKRAVRSGIALGVCALLTVFGVLLGCNIAARNMVNDASDLPALEQAAALDPFEWADYALSYVIRAGQTEADGETRQKADEYAARLGRLSSNSVPIYLAEYYLQTDRTGPAFEMAERYVSYIASDAAAWQRAFTLLERYERDTPEYRAGVAHIAGLLDAWNGENMGEIVLDGQSQAFIDRMCP